MTEVATPLSAKKPVNRTLAIVLSTLWAGSAATVLVVLLATIAVEAVPHARGIAFFPALRYAVVTPLSALVTLTAACLYRIFVERSRRPRSMLAATIAVVAVLVFMGMTVAGPPGLARAAFPLLLCSAVAIPLIVPRFIDHPRRSVLRVLPIALLGSLEVAGLVAARSSERALPPGPPGLPFEIPRSMFNVEHKFITLPGGTNVHYVDEGQGETLLFLHGNPSWSFQWRDLIHALRSSYRCIALDYPGFGLSKAPKGFGYTPREESLVVEEFIDQLDLKDITLVMQDWGGPIGLGFAGRHPERVRRVIFGSTWAWPTSTSLSRGKFSLVMGGPLGEFIQMNFNGFASFGINHGIVKPLPPDVLDVYLRPFLPLNRRGIAAFYPGQITAATDYFREVEAGLAHLADKKALIFWALQDPGVTRADLTRFEQAFPKHKTMEFPNARHFFFEDEAAAMIGEIRQFITSDQGDVTTSLRNRP